MKLFFKTTTSLIAFLLLASIGFAAPTKTFKSGKDYYTVAANSASAAINCYNNPSDVCIANYSNQTVNFDVAYPFPSQPVVGPLNPQTWVDAYSLYVFNAVYVSITNAYGQPIFNQYVPNHSTINISNFANAATGFNHNKLKVSIQ